jgi:transglutaminase/protease-like cytokinesis protein 3
MPAPIVPIAIGLAARAAGKAIAKKAAKKAAEASAKKLPQNAAKKKLTKPTQVAKKKPAPTKVEVTKKGIKEQTKSAKTYMEKASDAKLKGAKQGAMTRKENELKRIRKGFVKGASVGGTGGVALGYAARQSQETPRKALRKGRGLGK